MSLESFGPDGERLLVERFLRARRESDFRQLYQRHTPRLYLFVRRLLGGDCPEVDDVVQETWIRAAGRLERFEWRSSLATWLAGIAVNCSRETLRSRTRRRETPHDEMLEQPAPSLAPSIAVTMDLERAVADLPDGFREVLVLHDIEGYTHEEIGRLLGIETGTSKSQLHRARARLREWLRGERSTKP